MARSGYRIAGLPADPRSACSLVRPRTPPPGRCATNSVTFWCCCTAVSCSPGLSWGARCGGLPGVCMAIPAALSRWPCIAFLPPVIHACTYPNNEILTAFGLFASLYTAMGVAHAMQGPPRKWRSRIVLLTLTLAFTAASHVAAFLLALLLSIGFMAYLAVGRRAYIVPIMMAASIGTLLLVFASYDFSPDAFSYFFRSGAGRIWFSLQPARQWFLSLPNSAVTLAAATVPAALSAHPPIALFRQYRPLVSGPAVLHPRHPWNFERAHPLGAPFSAHFHRRGVCRFSRNPLSARLPGPGRLPACSPGGSEPSVPAVDRQMIQRKRLRVAPAPCWASPKTRII